MPIINPYNFVGFDPSLPDKQRDQALGFHHRAEGLSGRLFCTLQSRTPLFIPHSERNLPHAAGQQPGVRNRYFCRRGVGTSGPLIIPGSSLKGVLRTVVEAISSSGFTFFQGTYSPVTTNPRIVRSANMEETTWPSPSKRVFNITKRNDTSAVITADYASHGLPASMLSEANRVDRGGNGGSGRGLDAASRLFGVAPGEAGEEAFRAKVRIGEACLLLPVPATGPDPLPAAVRDSLPAIALPDQDLQTNPTECRGLRQHMLSAPKPHHEPFYLVHPSVAESQIRGRKFYLHHKPDPIDLPNTPPQNGSFLELIRAGVRFWFVVDYAQLTLSELGLLCRALALADDMAHKIGMGKPLGLGSAKIQIVGQNDLSESAHARWTDFEAGSSVVTGKDLSKKRREWDEALKVDAALFCAQAWTDLWHIWRWPPYSTANGGAMRVKYPSVDFFRDGTSGKAALPTPAQMQAQPLIDPPPQAVVDPPPQVVGFGPPLLGGARITSRKPRKKKEK